MIRCFIRGIPQDLLRDILVSVGIFRLEFDDSISFEESRRIFLDRAGFLDYLISFEGSLRFILGIFWDLSGCFDLTLIGSSLKDSFGILLGLKCCIGSLPRTRRN